LPRTSETPSPSTSSARLAGELTGTLARWVYFPLCPFRPLDRDPAASNETLKWNGIRWSGATMLHKIQRLKMPYPPKPVAPYQIKPCVDLRIKQRSK
jgi:hypothetical protein